MVIKIVKIKARRAFTPTKIPGADYVINQYVGCQHACRYCYAKFSGIAMGNGESCVRYQMEEKGKVHPDWMLPDGTLDERLQREVKNEGYHYL